MLENFFLFGEPPANAITGSYNSFLVALSYLVAFASSFVALDMAAQMMREKAMRLRRLWCLLGAVAFGGGTWAMHFTGMLAYQLPIAFSYAFTPTLLSLLMPILVSYLVLLMMRSLRFNTVTLIACSLVMGTAITSMHYLGMGAMLIPATVFYKPSIVLISILIAALASAAGIGLLYLVGRMNGKHQFIYRFVSANLMAMAVCGMHYTGMAAAIFQPLAFCRPEPQLPNEFIAAGIGAVTLLLLLITGIGLYIRNRMNEHLQSEVLRQTSDLQDYTAQLMLAKKTAEESSIAKTQFLANMSHEIRTPLNAIVGISEMLRNFPMTEERRNLMLATLHNSAIQLMQLLDDVLDLSRIEIGDLKIDPVPFDLQETVLHVVELLKLRAQEKKLLLECLYSPELPKIFIGDPKRLRQIFINLISNAIKFTDQGEVTIAIYPDAEKHQQTPESFAFCIEVEDTGIGIEQSKVPHIFEKFYQADSSTTRQHGGTGLGLTITKSIVEKMHGTIEVQSAPNAGTTFRIHLALPVAPDASPAI